MRPGESSSPAVNEESCGGSGSRAAHSKCSKFEICNIGARGIGEYGGTITGSQLVKEVGMGEPLTDAFPGMFTQVFPSENTWINHGVWHSAQ